MVEEDVLQSEWLSSLSSINVGWIRRPTWRKPLGEPDTVGDSQAAPNSPTSSDIQSCPLLAVLKKLSKGNRLEPRASWMIAAVLEATTAVGY